MGITCTVVVCKPVANDIFTTSTSQHDHMRSTTLQGTNISQPSKTPQPVKVDSKVCSSSDSGLLEKTNKNQETLKKSRSWLRVPHRCGCSHSVLFMILRYFKDQKLRTNYCYRKMPAGLQYQQSERNYAIWVRPFEQWSKPL